MTSAVVNAPGFPSLDYFRSAPRWVRTLLSLQIGLLLFAALLGLIGQAAESSVATFDRVGQTVDEPVDKAVDKAVDRPVVPAEKFMVEGRFKAAFPIAPKARTESLAEEGVSVDISVYTAVANGLLYVVSTVPFELDVPISFESLPADAAAEVDGKVQSATDTTFLGHRAMEVVITTDTGFVREMFVRTNTQLLTVIVGGGSAADYERFRDSVELF